MNNNLLRRIKASKDGAIIMGAAFLTIILLMFLTATQFYELPAFVTSIIAPATWFMGISTSQELVLGLPLNILFISFIMYVSTGYLVDWFHEPYK